MMDKFAKTSDGKHAEASGVKRVRTADGSYAHAVRSDSSTLSHDLGKVFKSNVRKAIQKR